MALVPSVPDDVTTTSPPKEYWDRGARVVRFGGTEGDVEKERQLVRRIDELGLLESKLYLERHLVDRLERLMLERDSLYAALSRCRRRRPLRDRLDQALSEIRRLIEPRVARDADGRKLRYDVSVLMGYFTANVRYRIDRDRNAVVVCGQTPGDQEKLDKEVVLEFPADVVMDRAEAAYCAGVFKVSVPFASAGSRRADERSAVGSVDTESLPSVDGQSVTSADGQSVTSADGQSVTSADGQSVTSSDDVHDRIPSPEAEDNRIIWV